MFLSPIRELFYVTANYNQWYVYGRHKGIDLRTRTEENPSGIGTEIRAVATGKYLRHGYTHAYGNYIVLQHGIKYRTWYAHLQNINHKPGWTTRYEGDCIGYSGNTGVFTTGPHLHLGLQMKQQGKWVWVDPMTKFIRFNKESSGVAF